MTMMVLGYQNYLTKHGFLRFYLSVFSFILVLIEKIYQTLKTVFDDNFQTPRSLSKILHYVSYFQFSSQCLEMRSNTVFRV